ncbi:MAG: N-6 DNA methylase [Candidatus Methanomethylicaceae archaeon]
MQRNSKGANLGFEEKLWKAADKLRSNMDAAEYKHVVLGLIFLKYITDAFNDFHRKLQEQKSKGADPEDPNEYRAENVFWVPKEARWDFLQKNAKQPSIGNNIQWGDSFNNDLHMDLKADYILANPPFNDSDWRGEQLRDDVRWKFGTPPPGNANFAWVQHFIHHLSPTGITGFVLANGSLSSNTSGEGEITKQQYEEMKKVLES